MNISSASYTLPTTPVDVYPDEMIDAPATPAVCGEQPVPADTAAVVSPPGAEPSHRIILPTREQLKLLEEMGIPITQPELDQLKLQKAEQERVKTLLSTNPYDAPTLL
ncbi:MAG: hypothetical protein H7Y33_18140 [Cytophagales bacterium]|nr:hypothetical protein [Rhizobacter sp.]